MGNPDLENGPTWKCVIFKDMGVEPKNRGKTPKMDGLFHGNPYFFMDDLGGFYHFFLETPISFLLPGCLFPTSSTSPFAGDL